MKIETTKTLTGNITFELDGTPFMAIMKDGYRHTITQGYMDLTIAEAEALAQELLNAAQEARTPGKDV